MPRPRYVDLAGNAEGKLSIQRGTKTLNRRLEEEECEGEARDLNGRNVRGGTTQAGAIKIVSRSRGPSTDAAFTYASVATSSKVAPILDSAGRDVDTEKCVCACAHMHMYAT
eukprot:3276074-Pleurochrysis_carterae.AAC.1